MNLCSIFAVIGPIGSTGFDDMLRLIGIAAIIMAVFKGVRSLVVKPAPPASAPPQAAAVQASAAPPQTVAAASNTPPANAKPQPAARPAEDEIAPEILAAIAAAVTCFMDQPHRIVSVKHQSTTWEKAGRQSVLTSHRIR